MKCPKGCSKSSLDKLWSLKVKEHAGFKCEICECTIGLSSHHFIARHNHSVRWFLENGVCLCDKCHTSSEFSAHQNPAWFIKQMLKLRGLDWLEQLSQQSVKLFLWKKNLEKIREYLAANLENYI